LRNAQPEISKAGDSLLGLRSATIQDAASGEPAHIRVKQANGFTKSHIYVYSEDA
jgi:hypothetical protein